MGSNSPSGPGPTPHPRAGKGAASPAPVGGEVLTSLVGVALPLALPVRQCRDPPGPVTPGDRKHQVTVFTHPVPSVPRREDGDSACPPLISLPWVGKLIRGFRFPHGQGGHAGGSVGQAAGLPQCRHLPVLGPAPSSSPAVLRLLLAGASSPRAFARQCLCWSTASPCSLSPLPP